MAWDWNNLQSSLRSEKSLRGPWEGRKDGAHLRWGMTARLRVQKPSILAGVNWETSPVGLTVSPVFPSKHTPPRPCPPVCSLACQAS